MSNARGCELPEGLYYWIEKHVWLREDADELLTLGITDVAQSLARRVVAVTAKKPGKSLSAGQSVATLESGKWVGPVPTPVDAEIVEVNPALATEPTLVNTDPYGTGWVVRLRPAGWAERRATLATGPEGAEAYSRFLEAEGISCG